MTEPVQLCKCCLGVIKPEAPEPQVHGLCPTCDATWIVFGKMTHGYRSHLAAEVICHSRRDIARRMGCTATAHNSAIGNACIRTGVKREVVLRVTRWALKNGLLDRPAGFEDCNPNGYLPQHAKGASEVKTTRVDPTPKPRKGGFQTGQRKAPKGSTFAARAGEFCPKNFPAPIEASPVAHSTVEATPQPGAPSETASNIAADEPPAPPAPEIASFSLPDLQSRLDRASDRSRRAYAALGRLTLLSETSHKELLRTAYECGWADGECRVYERLVEE